jgi:DNA-binding SARP family transcriptional activator
VSGKAAAELRLDLLRGFRLHVNGAPVSLIAGAQRVAALLALQNRPVTRAYVAGMLWPETPTIRANANLRSSLWRLQRSCRQLIDVSTNSVGLTRDVIVDVHVATTVAHRLIDSSARLTNDDLNAAVELDLSTDLLPDWYDEDWVIAERERFRHLRLHALEALCDRLALAGRYAEAIDAGLAATRAEPLRESAHRVLIRAHLAEGNRWEALRQYHRCRRLLLDELGVEPEADLGELVDAVDRRAAIPRRGKDGVAMEVGARSHPNKQQHEASKGRR